MPRNTIEIRQDAARRYYFVLSIPKLDIVFTSSAFKTREAVLVGVQGLRSSAGFNNRYERLATVRKELYFALWAPNNEILGTSVMFSSEAAREKAIQAVKRSAPNADIIDSE